MRPASRHLHQVLLLAALFLGTAGGGPANATKKKKLATPPPPRHHGYQVMMALAMNNQMDDVQNVVSFLSGECMVSFPKIKTIPGQILFLMVVRDFDEWTPNDKQNIWELSGLFEGDIIVDQARNAIRDHSAKWPSAVVPYHISDEFEEDDVNTIKGAMEEFHENSCIKFRPYKEGDSSWISIQGDSPGCWSYVGKRGGGQVVNLGNRCVQHGVVAHEILHALGFHHQQSASDRDKYVTIHWRNIRRGTERNFKKYSPHRISDLGVGYDYESVMHYSTHAFSKNGKPTIVPKEDGASIGQRYRMSEKDLQKLRIMYDCQSEQPKTEAPEFDFWGFHFR